MSALEAERARAALLSDVSYAIVALTAAGTHVIATREHVPREHQPLVTALRDNIGEMIRDVATLRDVALQKS